MKFISFKPDQDAPYELDRGGNRVSAYQRGHRDTLGAATLTARWTRKGPELEAKGDTLPEFGVAVGALLLVGGLALAASRRCDCR